MHGGAAIQPLRPGNLLAMTGAELRATRGWGSAAEPPALIATTGPPMHAAFLLQAAWYLKCRALTLKNWIDDTEIEEEVGEAARRETAAVTGRCARGGPKQLTAASRGPGQASLSAAAAVAPVMGKTQASDNYRFPLASHTCMALRDARAAACNRVRVTCCWTKTTWRRSRARARRSRAQTRARPWCAHGLCGSLLCI